ncbi:MAG: Crp/Fnr family transcriptional regulator [Burkholderiales bacterium]
MPRASTVEPSALGLQRVQLLAEVPLPALEALARTCRWRRAPAGEQVIARDAADRDVYLIVAGQVRVTAFSAAGRQVDYRDLKAGDWFGDFAALDGLARSASVVALADTLVAALPPAAFRRLLHDHPDACDRVLARLVAVVRELTDRVFDFSTLGVQNRVHAELLRLAREAGVERNAARLDPAPRHADLAARVSTYREQVTRELSALRKRGLIRRSGSALLVPDVARLEQIVNAVRRSV